MGPIQVNEPILNDRLAALGRAREWTPGVVSKLETLIRTGEDSDVYYVNPIKFAAERGVGEGETVDLFLHAVDRGLFEMDWNMVCGSCGGVTSTAKHLQHIHSDYECVGCHHKGQATFDDEIHIAFTVSPNVRTIKAPEGPFIPPKEEPFLSGKRLITTQTFRNLFRSEVVGGEEGIAIKDITILFTDLKGSTELYDQIGDPKAYYLVRQHFETLGRIVARFEGATIKTIGDAVMATFMNPLDGMQAALEMLRGIAEFNKNISEKLILKIGLHRGSSIAVTSNDRLDYFGQTVNIAARVQALAGPGEVYFTKTVYDYPGVTDLLDSKYVVASEEATLKGVSEAVQVYVISPP